MHGQKNIKLGVQFPIYFPLLSLAGLWQNLAVHRLRNDDRYTKYLFLYPLGL